MIEANYDEVICPNCVTQFRAIPVNVQDQITALTAERDEWKARCEFSFGQRDKLTAERDKYREKYNSTYSALDDCARLHSSVADERDAAREAVISNCARVMTVTAERDALKADAERYRWMTTQIVSGDLDVLEKALGKLDPEAESVTQEQFDGVIDAALKAVL